MKTCIIIPARLASTRLPNKILADINGKPMIQRVFEQCKKANCGDVFIATDSLEVKKLIGEKAILTNPSLPSGTDRIFAAYKEIGQNYDIIINVQGDVPNISPEVILSTKTLLENTKEADITTPVVEITDAGKAEKPNVVKAILAENGRALYFTRTKAPYGDGKFFEHIGLYAYKRPALEKFVSLKPSPLEKRESLEQLRALEAGMQIYANVVNWHPISVDVQEDLEFARNNITI